MGERLLGMQEAAGSTPADSTMEGIRLDEEPGSKPGNRFGGWGFESLTFR
jgi:hypothetical protein